MVRRSPLLLAGVLALVPAVALAVMLGPMHHGVPPQAVASPAPSPLRTPRPTPTPAPLPPLLLADRFDLAAARSFGRIDVTGYDHRGDVDISGYALAVTATPALPAQVPVWKLHGFADGANVSALLTRMGIDPATATPVLGADDGWHVDPAAAQVSAGISDDGALTNAGMQPGDDGEAITAVSRALRSLGLMPQNADATASSRQGSTTTIWTVGFARNPIGGVAVGFGSFTSGVASVEVTAAGNVPRLSVDEPSVDGGAVYPLRSWRDAWSDVARGHWFDECCDVNTGGGGPPHPVIFRAGSVSIAYEQVGSGAGVLVPMWVFRDSTAQLSLAIPALRLADLSEAGGFRLTQPGTS